MISGSRASKSSANHQRNEEKHCLRQELDEAAAILRASLDTSDAEKIQHLVRRSQEKAIRVFDGAVQSGHFDVAKDVEKFLGKLAQWSDGASLIAPHNVSRSLQFDE